MISVTRLKMAWSPTRDSPPFLICNFPSRADAAKKYASGETSGAGLYLHTLLIRTRSQFRPRDQGLEKLLMRVSYLCYTTLSVFQ